MRDETHRDVAVKAYRAYASGKLPVTTLNLRGPISPRIPAQGQRVYVLRLSASALRNPSFASLLTPTEPHGILYIGGHTSGKDTMRFMKMINACRRAKDTYFRKRYAENDEWHAHKVANMLTTGLLRTGFSIKDCLVDIVDGGQIYGEFELLVGYQETFHRLPPWNSTRHGDSAYIRSLNV